MKKFKETIYFHRDKESNWGLISKGEELEFKNSDDLKWVGMEVGMEVEIREDNRHKVLSIGGVDVSDKDVFI